MRGLTGVFALCAALLVSTGAQATDSAVLSSGKAAGPKEALSFAGHTQLLWVVGGGLVVGGVVLVATGNGHGTVSSSCPVTGCTTTTTGTSGSGSTSTTTKTTTTTTK